MVQSYKVHITDGQTGTAQRPMPGRFSGHVASETVLFLIKTSGRSSLGGEVPAVYYIVAVNFINMPF